MEVTNAITIDDINFATTQTDDLKVEITNDLSSDPNELFNHTFDSVVAVDDKWEAIGFASYVNNTGYAMVSGQTRSTPISVENAGKYIEIQSSIRFSTSLYGRFVVSVQGNGEDLLFGVQNIGGTLWLVYESETLTTESVTRASWDDDATGTGSSKFTTNVNHTSLFQTYKLRYWANGLLEFFIFDKDSHVFRICHRANFSVIYYYGNQQTIKYMLDGVIVSQWVKVTSGDEVKEYDIEEGPIEPRTMRVCIADDDPNLVDIGLTLDAIDGKIPTKGQKAASGSIPGVLTAAYESTAKTDMMKINNTAISVNHGACDSGTQRVCVATDTVKYFLSGHTKLLDTPTTVVGLETPFTELSLHGANAVIQISSTNIGDTQPILVEGYSDTMAYMSETVTLTGQTAALSSGSFYRVTKMTNMSTTTSLLGDVYLCTTGTGLTLGVPSTASDYMLHIERYENLSNVAQLFITPEAGKSLFMKHLLIG
ncbi:MAG: hypothetical protein GY799_18965 [Desulfobulbaceae bacterium]|nr:hypothetical protein [Desulfobulbaceae bacterium]